MIVIKEVTQTSDVGTFKKSVIPLLQVKFKDYNTASDNKDSVWDLVSKTLGIPKHNISVDSSHLDMHTKNYTRPLTVSYRLDSGAGALEIDKNIAIRGMEKIKAEIEQIKGVTQVWDLVSATPA